MKSLLFLTPILFISSTRVKVEKDSTHPGTTPVDGKIVFSNQPFSSNPATKTNFSSAEYIYAKLELNGSTLKEAFKIKESQDKPTSVMVQTNILRNGEIIHYGNSRDYILVSNEALNSNTILVDVIPEATKATTLYGLIDDFRNGYGFNPLVGLIRNGRHPSGDYKIRITVYNQTMNAYGSLHDEEKWPALSGEFDLKFSEDDVANMFANDDKTTDLVIANAFRYDKMPAVFSKPGKLTDPNATQAKIAAILKRDLPKRQILKWVAESYDGTYWHIAKDDYGLPRYKYFNPHIWMAYKIDGKCYIGSVTLRQVYSGGGTYGPLEVAFTSASGSSPDKGIDCVKVK